MGISTRIFPVQSFDLTFKGSNKLTMTFHVKEERRSRALHATNELVYSVIVNPHNDTDMGTYLEYIDELLPSDEVLIAWNVWENVGNLFYDQVLTKKWPPQCTRLGVNQYEVVIKYAPLFVVNFNINPLRTKIFQSRQNSAVWELDDGQSTYSTVPESSQSNEEKLGYSYINIDTEGNVDGTDVIDPMLTWTERWSFGPYDSMSVNLGTDNKSEIVGYIKNLLKLSCTLNDDKFRGFEKGEVLLRSVSGRHIDALTYEIDYTFSARPNKSHLKIGDVSINFAEGSWFTSGWAFADLTKGTKQEATLRDGRKVILPVPYTIVMHEVYKYSDFDQMRTYPDIPLDSSRQLGDLPYIQLIGGHSTLQQQVTAIVSNVSDVDAAVE